MNRRGFTLIELMIICSIIGVLSAIAIPKFAQLIQHSRNGATKGNLGSLRSALFIYYSELTFYPSNGEWEDTDSSLLIDTLIPKYLKEIPPVRIANHKEASTVYSHWTDTNGKLSFIHDGTNGWMYASGMPSTGLRGESSGMIIVGCTHTDHKGSAWNNY